jgi:hypothetical protein
VYNPARGGLSRNLTRKLRTRRPLRKRRRRVAERAVRFVAPTRLIMHRPAIVSGRYASAIGKEASSWEKATGPPWAPSSKGR